MLNKLHLPKLPLTGGIKLIRNNRLTTSSIKITLIKSYYLPSMAFNLMELKLFNKAICDEQILGPPYYAIVGDH
jgi:hypothetical protein